MSAIAQHETNGNLSSALREAITNYTKSTPTQRNTYRTLHILSDLTNNPETAGYGTQRINQLNGKRYKAANAFTSNKLEEAKCQRHRNDNTGKSTANNATDKESSREDQQPTLFETTDDTHSKSIKDCTPEQPTYHGHNPTEENPKCPTEKSKSTATNAETYTLETTPPKQSGSSTNTEPKPNTQPNSQAEEPTEQQPSKPTEEQPMAGTYQVNGIVTDKYPLTTHKGEKLWIIKIRDPISFEQFTIPTPRAEDIEIGDHATATGTMRAEVNNGWQNIRLNRAVTTVERPAM